MVSVSHMELQDQDSMCGPLLLEALQVPAHVQPPRLSHHMLGRTTSVKVGNIAVSGLCFIPTHFGMVKTAGVDTLPVSVPSTVPLVLQAAVPGYN